MREKTKWCTLACVGLAAYGCGAGDLEPIEGEPLGSAEEALSLPTFEHVQLTSTGSTTVECPSDKPWLLGTAGEALANPALKAIKPLGGPFGPTSLLVDAGITSGSTTAEAVCSNAMGLKSSGSSSTGSKTVMCGDGQIAVGGGGVCEGSGRLYRSRPSPDTDGSKPRGWAAGCTSGAVDTYAVCVWEDMNFDFSDCRTERKDGVGLVSVSCPSNFTALSAGGYCGDNNSLFNLDLDLSSAKVDCNGSSSTSVHAYVVCCR